MSCRTQRRGRQEQEGDDAWRMTTWQSRRRQGGAPGRGPGPTEGPTVGPTEGPTVGPTEKLRPRQRQRHTSLLCVAAVLCAAALAVFPSPAAADTAPAPKVKLRCRPIVTNGSAKLIPWSPREDRYLLPLCQYGGLNNQIICLRKYAWLAASLGRTLLLPRFGCGNGVEGSWYRWRWDTILDIQRMRECLKDAGPSFLPRVMSIDDLLRIPPNETHSVLHITCVENPKERVIHGCDGPPPDRGCVRLEKVFAPAPSSSAHLDYRLHGISNVCEENTTQIVLTDSPKLQPSFLEAVKHLAANMSVISLGSIFYEEVLGEEGASYFRSSGWNLDPYPGLGKQCADLWVPAPPVWKLAKRVANWCSGGEPFLSVHLRRGDFRISHKQSDEVFASHFADWLRGKNLTTIFVATDADNVTFAKIRASIEGYWQGPELKWCTMSDMKKVPGWEEAVEDLETGTGGVVAATIEKEVCGLAKYFFGNMFSTFSLDIARARIAKGIRSVLDAECG